MTVFDQVPVDRISAEARDVHFGRTLLLLIATLFYGAGWLAAKASIVGAKIFGALWLAAAWSITALKVGWQEGRKVRT